MQLRLCCSGWCNATDRALSCCRQAVLCHLASALAHAADDCGCQRHHQQTHGQVCHRVSAAKLWALHCRVLVSAALMGMFT